MTDLLAQVVAELERISLEMHRLERRRHLLGHAKTRLLAGESEALVAARLAAEQVEVGA